MSDAKKFEANDPVHHLARDLFIAMMAHDPTGAAMADPAKRAAQAYELAEVFIAKKKAMTQGPKGGGVGFSVR